MYKPGSLNIIYKDIKKLEISKMIAEKTTSFK
jgi:hypothetical protein